MTPGIVPSPDAIQFLAARIVLVLDKTGILSYIADQCELKVGQSNRFNDIVCLFSSCTYPLYNEQKTRAYRLFGTKKGFGDRIFRLVP